MTSPLPACLLNVPIWAAVIAVKFSLIRFSYRCRYHSWEFRGASAPWGPGGAGAAARQKCNAISPVCLCSNIYSAAHHFSSLSFLVAYLREVQLSPFPADSSVLCSCVSSAPPAAGCWCGAGLGETLFPQKSQHLSQLKPSSWLRIKNIPVRKPVLNTDEIVLKLMHLY